MQIKVQLYALLAKYLPPHAENKTATLDVPAGTTVKKVLESLQIPENMPKIMLVNGRNAELDKVVGEGDTLSIFPPIAGGVGSRRRDHRLDLRNTFPSREITPLQEVI